MASDGGELTQASGIEGRELAFPTGDLMIRVPRGKASQLAESLDRAGVEVQA